MKTKSFIPSLTVKTVHVVVVLAIALTSAFSVSGVKRAAAKSPEAKGSGLTLSALFSLVVPTYHRRQALQDRAFRFLGIDPGKVSWQGAEPTPVDDGRVKPTPTSSDNLPPTQTAAPTGAETPTPTITLMPTVTLTSSETLTPTQTVLPPSTPTPLPTDAEGTPSPTGEESTPTPSGEASTATPMVTETAPATQEIEGRIEITLTLTATPTLPAPGDILTLTWGTRRDRPLDGLELLLTLPEGFDLWGVPDGAYDPTTRQLRMPISLVAGRLSFIILPNAVGPYTFNAELWLNGELRVQRSFSLLRREPFRLSLPGGRAWGFNRRVEVTFPNGALPEAVDVEVGPPVSETDLPGLGGRPFEIVALSQATGQEVTQFTRPITIEVSYDEAQYGNEESGLKLYYYDENENEWYPLPTRVDTENNRLTAWSDHLTIFDFQAQNWEAARLPNLEAFQVSSFTGAASYSMQLEVPPGPAGLQPGLSLSYNSQTVDGASSRTQASWVGMGWSLGESYIQRNQNGTADFYGNIT
jgi:hypothetical protein